MTTKTKQTAASKAFEKRLKALKVNEVIGFKRGGTTATFLRQDYGVATRQHPTGQGDGVQWMIMSCREAADWWTEDDGKGEWTEVK